MGDIYLQLITQTKQSYQPDTDQLPLFYNNIQSLATQLQLAEQAVQNASQEIAQNAKRSKQLRYLLVSLNYEAYHNKNSEFNISVGEAKRQYLAKFDCQLSEKIGFGLFSAIEDLGEIIINDVVVRIVKGMQFLTQWTDVIQYYHSGQIEVIQDFGY